MSKAEQTKAFIIEKAAAVFNVKGYAATSLSDIQEATGLTKGAIYGNFKDKEEVAVAVYQYCVSNLNERLKTAMSGHDSANDQLRAFVNFYRNNWKVVAEHGGCPIQNASVEADDHLAFLKEPVKKSIITWADSIASVIKSGQARGEFRKEPDPLAYAYSIIALLEGGIMLLKIMGKQQYLQSVLDRIDSMIEDELCI